MGTVFAGRPPRHDCPSRPVGAGDFPGQSGGQGLTLLCHGLLLYCNVQYSIALYCTILYSIVFTVLYRTVMYSSVQYCMILYCTRVNCYVLYCSVLHCTNFAIHCLVLL